MSQENTRIEVTTLREVCPDKRTCPAIKAINITPDLLYLQGPIVTDQEILDACGVPPSEGLIAFPGSLIPEV